MRDDDHLTDAISYTQISAQQAALSRAQAEAQRQAAEARRNQYAAGISIPTDKVLFPGATRMGKIMGGSTGYNYHRNWHTYYDHIVETNAMNWCKHVFIRPKADTDITRWAKLVKFAAAAKDAGIDVTVNPERCVICIAVPMEEWAEEMPDRINKLLEELA